MRKLPKRHKGKAKRWPRGQSSNSNPETKKFRDAAKSRFFRHESLKSSNLTVGALKTLDAFNNSKCQLKGDQPDNFNDNASFDSWASAQTFKTFASDWSECSNVSFNRLMKKFEPSSALHKEMLAVLAAVTEVIKTNGGKETTTEYFGALMTALNVTEAEESLSGILSLLTMCMRTVPTEVLRLKFSESSQIFLELLRKYCEVENSTILRSVIGCLSVVLRAQDPCVWSNSSTVEIFHSILVFVTHSKPRIRKSAQHAVCAILKASSMFSEEDIHPAAINAAKYCIQQLEKGDALGGNTTTLHILALLRDIIGTFPKYYIKSACETVLKLMTLGNALTVSCALEVLHGLFTSHPPTNRLSASLNAQILNALYDYQPSSNDCQATLAWLTVMQECLKTLVRSDPQLCLENCPKFFLTASHLWLNDKNEIISGCTLALKIIALDCLPACSECRNYRDICRNIFGIVENGLKYQYHTAWVHIFTLLGILFETIGEEGEYYMVPCLKSLANLRDSHNFSYISQLDHTIGKAIRSLGPEIVLKAIPFTIPENESNYEFKTSWILPLLKENVQSSSLKFYIDYFLPLAEICEKRIKDLNLHNGKIGSHVYELLQLQIWSILPSFCNNASDVGENFKLIARTLGNIICDRKQLRVPVMASLRKLIGRSIEKPDKADLNELARFSKNYLPILFRLYTTKPCGSDENGERLAAFETIKVYLPIANGDICAELFDRALKRVEESEKDAFVKESVMDLLKLLIPFQNEDRLRIIYRKCLETLKMPSMKKEEKKAYRLLEVLAGSDSNSCKKFMLKNSKELIDFILKSLRLNNIKYRGARLRCILQLLKYIPNKEYNIIRQMIPEAVICCKDINKRTKGFAFKLLEQIFFLCRKWSQQEEEDIIRDYIQMIAGGLAGTPTLVSATVLALAKLTSVLRSELPLDMIQFMLDSVRLLCSLPTREIVSGALTYLKVFTTAFSKNQLLPHVPSLVNALVSMTNDTKSHFRHKTRDILDRLLRKFGYESIKCLVPQDDIIMHKRLKNLKKINMKKQAAKTDLDDPNAESIIGDVSLKTKPQSIDEILASSDDSEDEESDTLENKSKSRGETYIQEDPDNIIDLLQPNTSSKITAIRPENKKKMKTRDVKTSSDGRLIIMDEEVNIKEDDSDLEDLESMMSDIIIGRKRKLSISSDAASKYYGGGSGIHRPLKCQRMDGVKNAKKKEKTKSSERILPMVKTGKEYRAKKARGDVKLKGKPDPYAYIPLSRKLLNKRKRQKSSAQFKGVIQAALKGAKKGSKAKIKMKK